MYAIIETGGKQYKVSPGEKIRVERIRADVGASVQIDNVLLVAGEEVVIGTPHVESTPVQAKVLAHGRGDKVNIIKMKRRKNYRRKQGHRQDFSELEITSIGDTTAPEVSNLEKAETESKPEDTGAAEEAST